jgi:hypothetical protein
MVKTVIKRIRPGRGFAHVFHLSLVAVVPLVVYFFVRLEFFGIALAVVLLSKWRIFAVHPRHWLAHIRTNSVDLIVGLSILTFMIVANGSMITQLFWVLMYEIWVLYIKPGTSLLLVSLQGLIAQFAGLVAVFLAFGESSLSLHVLFVVAVTYFSARHFFASFEEVHGHTYAWLWAFFSGCLMWILGHFLIFYGAIAQPALLLSVLGYGLAALYYLSRTDKLSKLVQRQIVFVMIAISLLCIISIARTSLTS